MINIVFSPTSTKYKPDVKIEIIDWYEDFLGRKLEPNQNYNGKVEEFIENLIQLKTVYDLNLSFYIIIDEEFYYYDGELKKKDFDLSQKAIVIGLKVFLFGKKKINEVNDIIEKDEFISANEYFKNSTVLPFMNREVLLSSTDDLADNILTMYNKRKRRIFIKCTRPKYGIYSISLTKNETIKSINKKIIQELDYAIAHLEALEDAFLIQEYLEMKDEYRFIVLNKKLVTGSPKVEEYTPIDNTEIFFKKFSDGINNDLFNEYYSFANKAVKEINLKNYVLDVAMTDKGIVLVELNPLRNYGLFACNFKPILHELMHIYTTEEKDE